MSESLPLPTSATNTLVTGATSGSLLSWNGTSWVERLTSAVNFTSVVMKNTGNYTVTMSASNSQAANYALTFPTTDGNASQVLQTDGSGVLSWVDQSGGGGPTADTDAINLVSSPSSTISYTKEHTTLSTNLTTTPWLLRSLVNVSNRVGNVVVSKNRVFKVGCFTSNASFYDSSNVLQKSQTVTGSPDMFLMCYDHDGVVQWGAKIAISSNGLLGPIIACDSNNNLYITAFYGAVGATITAYNANGTAFGTTIASSGAPFDSLVAKYNSSGVVQWLTKITGNNGDYPSNISVTDDAVYLAGSTASSSIVFEGSDLATITVTTGSGNDDAWVARYNTSGVVQWALKMAATGGDYSVGLGADNKGVYVSLFTDAAVTLYNSDQNSSGVSYTPISNTISVVAKYSTAGYLLWSASIDFVNAGAGKSSRIFASSLYNDIYYVYMYYSASGATIAVKNANGKIYKTLAGANQNTMIVGYNSDGNPTCAYKVSNAASGFDYIPSKLVVNNCGIFLAETMYSTQTIYDSTGATIATATLVNTTDLLLRHYTLDGVYVNRMVLTSGGNKEFSGMDMNGISMYVAASFAAASVTFGTNSVSRSYTTDLFLGKYVLGSEVKDGGSNPSSAQYKTLSANDLTSSHVQAKLTGAIKYNSLDYYKIGLLNKGSSARLFWNGTYWTPISLSDAVLVP